MKTQTISEMTTAELFELKKHLLDQITISGDQTDNEILNQFTYVIREINKRAENATA